MTLHTLRVALLLQPRLACALATPAFGQASYPSQTIRFVIPAGAGGLPDTVARILGKRLQEKVGQNVVVENRAGGNGAVSVGVLMSSPPDGHAFIVQDGSIYANQPAHLRQDGLQRRRPCPDVLIAQRAAIPCRASENAGHVDERIHRLREDQSRQA